MTAERRGRDIAHLVEDHHQAVYRYAYRLSGSVADAEDLTQQTFLAAQQKLHQLHDWEKARGWLFAVLRNSFLKGCQQRRRMGLDNAPIEITDLPATAPADEAIDRERLQLALDQLSSDHRIILLMFYFEDLSYREIAAQLEVPIGTVMSRLARAKRSLRGLLFQDATSDGRSEPVASRQE